MEEKDIKNVEKQSTNTKKDSAQDSLKPDTSWDAYDAVVYIPNAAIGRFGAARAMNQEIEEIEKKTFGGKENE